MAGHGLDSFVGKLLFLRGTRTAAADCWKQSLGDFLEVLGRQCEAQGGLIGHIKAFAAGPWDTFLRGSLVDLKSGADVEGDLPETADSFVLNFNAHVHGLAPGVLAALVQWVAAQISGAGVVEVRVLPDAAMSSSLGGAHSGHAEGGPGC